LERHLTKIAVADVASQLEWQTVLQSNVDSAKPVSKEELLRRERMRVASFGITNYVFDDVYV
jgi:hypothetical protein